ELQSNSHRVHGPSNPSGSKPTSVSAGQSLDGGRDRVAPVTSSMSAKHREPLCSAPFSQVASNRRSGLRRSRVMSGSSKAMLPVMAPLPRIHAPLLGGGHRCGGQEVVGRRPSGGDGVSPGGAGGARAGRRR